MSRDFANSTFGGQSIAPGTEVTAAGETNGAAVDFQNGEGPIHAVGMIGNSVELDAYKVVWKLEESATGSGAWSDIAGATVTTEDGSEGENDLTEAKITTGKRTKRYVRLTATVSEYDEESSSATPVLKLAGYLFAERKYNN